MMRPNTANWIASVWKSGRVTHSARTAVTAAVSFTVAGLFQMRESYWAAVATILVTQSTPGAAWAASRTRFVGTAVGAAFGGFLASCSEPRIMVLGEVRNQLSIALEVRHQPGQRGTAMSGQIQPEDTKVIRQAVAQFNELLAVTRPTVDTNQRDSA